MALPRAGSVTASFCSVTEPDSSRHHHVASFTRFGHGTSTMPQPPGGVEDSSNGSVTSTPPTAYERMPAATWVITALACPSGVSHVSSYWSPVGARILPA